MFVTIANPLMVTVLSLKKSPTRARSEKLPGELAMILSPVPFSAVGAVPTIVSIMTSSFPEESRTCAPAREEAPQENCQISVHTALPHCTLLDWSLALAGCEPIAARARTKVNAVRIFFMIEPPFVRQMLRARQAGARLRAQARNTP